MVKSRVTHHLAALYKSDYLYLLKHYN